MSFRDAVYRRFVHGIYARHNEAPRVKAAVAETLRELDAGGRGADLGCGPNKLHPRLLRVDLMPEGKPDCRADLHHLPFRDGALRVVISREVFEHLADPWAAAREVHRVLEPGGLLYLQTPFIIGRHAGPDDYWRFTRQGLEQLLGQSGLRLERLETSVGPGTGIYRIAVEFVAALGAAVTPRAYLPAKAAGALVCAPLRWADHLRGPRSEADRIAGGFLALARKV